MMSRSLRLEAFNSGCSSAVLELTHAVHERKCASEWLDMVEREAAFLMAMTRRIVEQRKEAENAAEV